MSNLTLFFGLDALEGMDPEIISEYITQKKRHEPEITSLVADLPPVMPFDFGLLPQSFSPYIIDVQKRLGCPADYLAIAIMIALATVVGRKVGIHPKANDDWLVIPNLWGVAIGRPSAKKTPALNAGLKPLYYLQNQAYATYAAAQTQHDMATIVHEAKLGAAEKAIKDAAQGKGNLTITDAENNYRAVVAGAIKKPTEQRYIINDATVEALGEKMNQNPNGLLMYRDEVIGWFRGLDREDAGNDRAFYLESFNGNGSYIYDRIGRGTIKIESTTLSVLGGIQPSKLEPYIANTMGLTGSDDGFMQRFQLAVYPDNSNGLEMDVKPDQAAEQQVYDVFIRLNALANIRHTDARGSEQITGLRFSDMAQIIFDDWYHGLTYELKSGDLHPAIESHLGKYASLVPSIALLLCLVDEVDPTVVDEQYVQQAIAWATYLRSHMVRIYHSAITPEMQGAMRIFSDKDKLPHPFKTKDVKQKGWTGLDTTETAKSAITILLDHGYLVAIDDSKKNGGRPSESYRWNLNLEDMLKAPPQNPQNYTAAGAAACLEGLEGQQLVSIEE
jgi:putative DNA primase/helicase